MNLDKPKIKLRAVQIVTHLAALAIIMYAGWRSSGLVECKQMLDAFFALGLGIAGASACILVSIVHQQRYDDR